MARFPMGVPLGWEFTEDSDNFFPSNNEMTRMKATIKYRANDGLVILSDSQFEELQKRFKQMRDGHGEST